MTVKTGQSWQGLFVTLDATGALASGTPSGTLYVNGTSNGASVTISGSNPYKFSVTLPALTAGQRVDMYITATIDGISTAGIVASEQADTALTSEVKTETAAILADTGTDGVKLAADQAVDVTKIGGQAINGYNATLKLKALDIQNSSGTAVNLVSTGGNGTGLKAIGNGAGHGFFAKGGDTGNGAFIQGGEISGNGVSLSSKQVGTGAGLSISGANYGVWAHGTNGDISADEIAAIKAKTDTLPASPAAVGSAMTLTSGERIAIANEVEAQIINETDSEKVLKAITDKIAEVNPSLDDLTLAGIASAVRTELATELARIDAAISSRLASVGYTAPDNASVTAIKAKTDQLAFTVANQVDANALTGGATAEDVRIEMDANSTKLAEILTDTGTDGVVLKASGLAADAVTEIQSGLALETTLNAVKAKTDLITTGTVITVTSPVSGSTITAIRGDTLVAVLENIGSLVGYTNLWFTVKRDYVDADTAAIIQIEKTAGLKYLNGATGTPANGSLTIDDEATGDITIALDEVETAKLDPGVYVYDVQVVRTAGTVSTLTAGTFEVAADVTRATA